ncbi:MAG: ABC-type transport system, periplasmic component [Candidatus Methanohalarchaeum thermophilum]|uniref:ABC-type transport system, periplasmic component n=1 Tax=Methanohalarchaeum thermophilum TaxID=1903181 RepID=A0A1Q6DT04_METT1|nr:MAG: ABC-type transport system, periplasmic component [Candidatus Methanohalarchaeum thermophilum]
MSQKQGNKFTRRKFLKYTGVAGATILAGSSLTGCLKGGEEEKVDTAVIGTTDSVTTLDPANCYEYFSSEMLFNTMDRLTGYKPGTSELVPVLAKDWEANKDTTKYTLPLREGVKFQNGNEMLAEDVKFSLERAINLEGKPAFLLGNIDSVNVVDDYTVELDLKSPSSLIPSKLAYTVGSIVPKEEYNKNEFQPEDAMGTGPYQIDDWQKGSYITLVENEEYWGDSPFAETIKFKFYKKSSQLKMALNGGELDAAYRQFQPLQRQALRENEEVETKSAPSPSIRYLVLNVQKSPTKQIGVRKAIAYAINRNEIDEQVYAGSVEPLYSMVPKGMWSHEQVFKQKYGTGSNIEEAQAQLEEAGYSKDNPLEMNLWYTTRHYGPLEGELATTLKKQIEETEMVDVTLQSSGWGTYASDLDSGKMRLFLLGWYPDYIDPDDYIGSPFLSESGSKSTGSFYANDQAQELINQEKSITDREERTEIFKELQNMCANDIPLLPLFQKKQFSAFQPHIKKESFIMGPAQIFRGNLLNSENWE